MEYTNKNKTVFCKHGVYKCKYAHGIEYIHTIECKYGPRCINPRCNFNHGLSKSRTYPIYEPIIKYKKNKKIIKPIYLNNIKNKIIIDESVDEKNNKEIIKSNEEKINSIIN